MQLIGKAGLWLHVTLHRLTSGRIGGRFISETPILLLTTIRRRSHSPMADHGSDGRRACPRRLSFSKRPTRL
jgi:hypothetical protein